MADDLIEGIREDCRKSVEALGQFWGEPLYVPYFWDLLRLGHYPQVVMRGDTLTVPVTPDDRDVFPELDGVEEVRLYVTLGGLVGADQPPGWNLGGRP